MVSFTIHCNVCFRDCSLHKVRSLRCGHTYCNSCLMLLSSTARNDRKKLLCPECRSPFAEQDLRRVFLTPGGGDGESSSQAAAESSEHNKLLVQHAQHVSDALFKLDVRANPAKVQEIQRDIQVVAEAISAEPVVGEAASIIWNELQAFKQRLVPLFRQVAEQAAQLRALREEADAKARDNEKLLKDALGAVERANKYAAEREREQSEREALINKLKAENAELRIAREEVQSEYDRIEGDNRRYKGMLEEHKKAENRTKADLHSLKQKTKQQASEIERLKRSAPQNEDETLVVLAPDSDEFPGPYLVDLQDQGGGLSQSRKRRKLEKPFFTSDNELSSTEYTLPACSSPPQSPTLFAGFLPPSSPRAARAVKKSRHSKQALSKSRPNSSMEEPPLARPRFGSDWALPKPDGVDKRKMVRSDSGKLPFPVDVNGKAKGTLQLGLRKKMSK